MATAAAVGTSGVSAAQLWASLSEVERTCLQVAFVRWHESSRKWPDGRPWYEDPHGALWVQACIPPEQQEQMLEWKAQGDRIADVMAVRTAEIDSRIHDAAYAPSNGQQLIKQLVIVGAGADMRAWRLKWPAGFKVFEVDSATVLDFKARVLSAASPVFKDSLAVERVEVVADASKPEELWAKLLLSGLDADQPVFWLLEGLIGYLRVEEGSQLLAALQEHSMPHSRIVVTVPPAPAVAAAAKAVRAAAAAAAGLDSAADVAAPVHMGEGAAGGVSTVQASMPHVTYEDPKDTLWRVNTAGWQHSELLTAEWLASKYGVDHAQPIVVARKE